MPPLPQGLEHMFSSGDEPMQKKTRISGKRSAVLVKLSA